MTTREWSSADYYRVLGVGPQATQAEITATYRMLVKSLHPDTRPGDQVAAERFKRVTVAYRVLADPDRRRSYDGVRRSRLAAPAKAPRAGASTARAASPGPPEPDAAPRTRRGARWAVAGGIACLVAGIAVSVLVLALERRDAALRSEGKATTATVVQVGADRKLDFTTASGAHVVAPEPLNSGTGDARVGSRVQIRYDPKHPTHVITTDSTLARDITLWIVAGKLLLGGAFFIGYGVYRLRRAAARSR